MKFSKQSIAWVMLTVLAWAAPAQAALVVWTSGDLMILRGAVATGDHERLKKALTPAIRTVVVRDPTGWDFYELRKAGQVIEDAGVTTVAHGSCGQLACAMLFLSGKQRMFSGVGHPLAHYVSLAIGEHSHVLAMDKFTKVDTLHSWWRDHTKLSAADVTQYRDSFWAVRPAKGKLDKKVFFPQQAGFPKGDVIHCSGFAESTHFVDCMAVADASALSKGIVTTDTLFVDPRLIEAADLPVPPATGFAPLEADIGNRFSVSDKCKEMYRQYLKQPSPKAFVVNSGQSCNWTSMGFRPLERAIQTCEKGGEGNRVCRLYAVDDNVVFTAF